MAEKVITPEMAAIIDAMGKLWQPIETAPKDRPILLFCGRLPLVSRWVVPWHGTGEWEGLGQEGMAITPPSHWMPLPEPPK